MAAVLWSLGGLLAKVAPIQAIPLESRGPLLACYRALFAAVVLTPFVAWRRVRWRAGLLPMALSYAIMNVLYVTSLTRTTAAAAIFLQYTSIAWSVVIGWLLLRERVDRGDLVALACAAAGIGCIVVTESDSANLWGNLLGVGSGLTYAGVIVGLRAMRGEDGWFLVLVNNAVGGLVLLPWVWSMHVSLSGMQWGVVAAFGVVQLAIPYVLFAFAVRTVRAHEAALLTILEAVLNPLWVWMFVGEAAATSTWLGGGLIVLGLVLRYSVFMPHPPRVAPDESAPLPDTARPG